MNATNPVDGAPEKEKKATKKAPAKKESYSPAKGKTKASKFNDLFKEDDKK